MREVKVEISLPEGGRTGAKTSMMLRWRKYVSEGSSKTWSSVTEQVWIC